jgi:DNA-directed RNA polymerase specialized sigma24 family protein
MNASSSNDESPTIWIEQLRTGQSAAAQKLWQSYFERLVRLARQKLQGRPRLASDEEDVALSAFNSFCQGIEAGRYPQISDRDDLWRLLVTITLHKTLHLVRDQGRQKRGGQWTVIESPGSAGDDQAIDRLVGKEPSPEFVAQLLEQWDRLVGKLDDATLAEIAVRRMEGYTNREIAERLNVAERTIERKLRLIRTVWEEGEADDGN